MGVIVAAKVAGTTIFDDDIKKGGSKMPHIDISMFAGRDDATKKRVADAVVETMMKELGCQKSHLSVAIHDVAPENWNEEVHDKVDASLVYSGEVYKAE